MMHDFCDVLRIKAVHDVEEVLAGRPLLIRKRVREVPGELLVLLELGPQRLHGEFIILGHLDVQDLGLLQERFLLRKDQLQKVFVDLRWRRKIVLDYKEVTANVAKYLRCLSR